MDMNLKTVKLLHLSDLHISLNNVVRHNLGHDMEILKKLDESINKLDWDALIISGDVSDRGQYEDFIFAKNWIEGNLNIEDGSCIGLNLNSNNKPYFIVPGNHDRFNRVRMQTDLSDYHKFFPNVENGEVIREKIKDVTFNFHLFDSSTDGGFFAYGNIDNSCLVKKNLIASEVDIAILHHNIIHPLQGKRFVEKYTTHLKNAEDVLMHVLSCKYNCIMFGHTHHHYIDYIPMGLMLKLSKGPKWLGRIFYRVRPKLLTALVDNGNFEGISLRRKPTKSGKYVTFSKYAEYLYIKYLKLQPILGPEDFNTPNEFYNELNKFQEERDSLKTEIKRLKREKVIVSMAPSACARGNDNKKGFSIIEFDFMNGINTEIRVLPYRYTNGEFRKIRTLKLEVEN